MALGDFFSKLGSKLGGKSEVNRSLFFQYGKNIPLFNEGNTKNYVDYGYMQNALAFTIINKISLIASQVPFKLYRMKADGQKVEVKQHEILNRWKFPNKYEGGHEFRKKLCDFYLTTGNAYMYGSQMTPGNWETLANWMIMPSQNVSIELGDWTDPIKSYTLDQDGTLRKFDADRVIHWKETNLDYQVGQQNYGMSKLKPLEKVLSSSSSAFDAKIKDFSSGGVKGFLTVENEDDQLTPEQGQELIAKISKSKLGLINSKVAFEEVGLSTVDMDVINSLKSDFNLMCAAYGINPGLFEPDTTFENQRMYMRALYTQVIMPMLYSLYDRLNAVWVVNVQSNLMLEPDFSNVKELEEDLLQRALMLNQAEPWLTKNEMREIMGLPRIESEKLDEVWVELGTTPASDFDLPPAERNPMGTQSRQTVNQNRQNRVDNSGEDDE